MPDVPISDHPAFLARCFNIDLPAVADEALREHLLREPVKAFTPRMRAALLAAREEAHRLGHSHIRTEHVFLYSARSRRHSNPTPAKVRNAR